METHAHHLHKAPGNKGWHYFNEFLMLFMAVTLGFFVENQREQFVEHKRAKEYAQSLYDDLKTDTMTIHRTIGEKIWIRAKFDSAASILTSAGIGEKNEFLYYTARYLMFNDAFTAMDVTYQQLKSSGSIRYIKNISLYKKIGEYYNLYSRYQAIDRYGQVEDPGLSELLFEIFDLEDYFSIRLTAKGTFYDMQRPTSKLKPLTLSPKNRKMLYYKFATARGNADSIVIFLNWLNDGAIQIMNELKNEYDLK
jgi:hypothetical protein